MPTFQFWSSSSLPHICHMQLPHLYLLPQTKYKELGLKPYVAHATFQYSGTPGKRNRFREFLLWDDPPSYFNSDKGFISMQ